MRSFPEISTSDNTIIVPKWTPEESVESEDEYYNGPAAIIENDMIDSQNIYKAIAHFTNYHNTIEKNLKSINLDILILALEFLMEINCTLFLVKRYIKLIRKKGEMNNAEINHMKKIIRENNERDIINKVVEQGKLPKELAKGIGEYVRMGGTLKKRTRGVKKIRKKRYNKSSRRKH